MYNCLVTKLKEVVNDDTLPVFVNVSDYEEYIEASGNTGMTDAQKYAVAEFFGSLGAKSSGGIWSKIKYLYLPLLCADVSKSLVDYKVLTSTLTTTSLAIANHGVYATAENVMKTVTIPSIDPADLSVFWLRGGDFDNVSSQTPAVAGASILNSSGTHIVHFIERGDNSDGSTVETVCNTGSPGWFQVKSDSTLRAKGKLKGATINGSTIKSLNGEYQVMTNSQSCLSGTLTNATMRVFSYIGIAQNERYTMSMLLVASALTDTEVAKLKTASEKLAQAFLVDEAS